MIVITIQQSNILYSDEIKMININNTDKNKSTIKHYVYNIYIPIFK